MATPSSAQKVEVLERTEGYVVAAWRRLLLLVWRGPATAEGITRSRAHFDRWAVQQTGGAVFLVVVPAGRTRAPDEQARAAMEQTAARPSPHLRGMATLLEAEGFIAAAVRSMMMRLSGQRVVHVFRTPAEAADWAAQTLGDRELGGEALAEVIRQAREG
jgi:hypothetical protein